MQDFLSLSSKISLWTRSKTDLILFARDSFGLHSAKKTLVVPLSIWENFLVFREKKFRKFKKICLRFFLNWWTDHRGFCFLGYLFKKHLKPFRVFASPVQVWKKRCLRIYAWYMSSMTDDWLAKIIHLWQFSKKLVE